MRYKLDKYSRLVAKVYLINKDICLASVKAGMSWHYKEYESEQSKRDRKTYSASEARARKLRLGLWKQDNPIIPSIFRHPVLRLSPNI